MWRKWKEKLAVLGPGMLVAATGVGAGDLATASFSGSQLGTRVLWAVIAGAFLKFVMNEGLMRWQLATGTTLIEGLVVRFGPLVMAVFLPYLLFWSFFVGLALMSACGVTVHALVPLFDDPDRGKILWAIVQSLLGLGLVWWGGYRWFERVMGACTAIMFFTVLSTAAVFWPGTSKVLSGLVPRLELLDGEALRWTVALIGGIGGTVTVLSYGYWIREEGRDRPEHLSTCRLDLFSAYLMTALFGMAMVIIGTTVDTSGTGSTLLMQLAERLEERLGEVGRVLFLLGAWAAVFTSLLGVWQAVPYLFADVCAQWNRRRRSHAVSEAASDTRSPVDTGALPYRAYLLAIALVPMLGLWYSFKEVQRWYSTVGAWFLPMLALALLVLNSRESWIGSRFRNRWTTNGILVLTLLFFSFIAWRQWGE